MTDSNPGVEQHDEPTLFRLTVEVGDIDKAFTFYSTLLGVLGRKQAGERYYFTCGSVTLQVLDVSRHHAVA
ncbi:MAG: hypothetical protein JO285_16425, partial [Kutzneria sp.]|nr:hypothetical protein [Kutzneria sp.]